MGEVSVLDENGKETVTLDESGVIGGGHAITEEDFNFMTRELREQFQCLSGRGYSLLEELGLPEKQEAAAKRHFKGEVWQRFNDFVECMRMYSRVSYQSCETGGIPDDKE